MSSTVYQREQREKLVILCLNRWWALLSNWIIVVLISPEMCYFFSVFLFEECRHRLTSTISNCKEMKCINLKSDLHWKVIEVAALPGIIEIQECIPVGCVPPACWPYPSMHCAGGCIPAYTTQGVSVQGVSARAIKEKFSFRNRSVWTEPRYYYAWVTSL